MIHEVLCKDGTEVVDLDCRRAVRHFCMGCCDFILERVVACESEDCVLQPYRLGHHLDNGLSSEDRARAVLQYCTECAEANGMEKASCDAKVCALYPFRNRDQEDPSLEQESAKPSITGFLKSIVNTDKAQGVFRFLKRDTVP